MTIKELCDNRDDCYGCPFKDACLKIPSVETPDCLDEVDDNSITRSIIETARILQEDDNED